MIKAKPISNRPDFDAWRDALTADAKNQRVGTWKLVDRLGEGRERFGDELFWQAVHDTRLAEATITNYLGLYKVFPKGKRVEAVPVSIHETIRSLKDDDQRMTVLKLADEFEWTRENVRDRMEASKAGDPKCWDPRWKPKAKPKVIEVIEEAAPAGGSDDIPVMDSTSSGQAMNAQARAEVLTAVVEPSGADQKLLAAVAAVRALRLDPTFLNSLDAEGHNSAAVQLEGQWLVNVGTQLAQKQRLRDSNSARLTRDNGDGSPQASSPVNQDGESASRSVVPLPASSSDEPDIPPRFDRRVKKHG